MLNSTVINNITPNYVNDKERDKTTNIVLFTVEILQIIIGLIGNSLSFLVTLRTNLRRLSTTVYLSVLSVCDNIVLLAVPFARNTLLSDIVLGIDIANIHLSLCLILNYISFWMPHLSSWCLVAVTFERTVAVLIPHK